CVPGEQLLISDTPRAFAGAVVDLLRDDARRASLGEAGRRLVEERYSWDYCGAQMLAAIEAAHKNGWHV
ncbi:MAG TPA: glycosyltransferase, partial [Ktedonobacterales bacterium]|nr:glycosyltransferase [Ktedonobacterales bacterium]